VLFSAVRRARRRCRTVCCCARRASPRTTIFSVGTFIRRPSLFLPDSLRRYSRRLCRKKKAQSSINMSVFTAFQCNPSLFDRAWQYGSLVTMTPRTKPMHFPLSANRCDFLRLRCVFAFIRLNKLVNSCFAENARCSSAHCPSSFYKVCRGPGRWLITGSPP